MLKDWNALTQDISKSVGQVRIGAADVMKGFSAMAQGATQPGLIDTKAKELIALALGIAARCDGCIGFHAKALVELQASRGEIMEVIGMAVYMGGGPSVMYGALALDAFDQFTGA